MKLSTWILLCCGMLLSYTGYTQRAEINWLSFEQLEDSLAVHPKKVFINFYADWCAYCKKMDRAAFRNSEVIAKLHAAYYAVKMNAEAHDTIRFGGDTFYNRAVGKKRNPTHEIPLLLASREGYPFSLPAVVILDENFQITQRYFEYLSPKRLLELLSHTL